MATENATQYHFYYFGRTILPLRLIYTNQYGYEISERHCKYSVTFHYHSQDFPKSSVIPKKETVEEASVIPSKLIRQNNNTIINLKSINLLKCHGGVIMFRNQLKMNMNSTHCHIVPLLWKRFRGYEVFICVLV